MEDIKFALLIDSDNISADYIKIILDELSKYGTVTYKKNLWGLDPFQFKQMEGCAVSQFHQPGTAIQLYDR